MHVLTVKDWKATNAGAKQMLCDLQMKVVPGKYLQSRGKRGELSLCYQAHETGTMTEMKLDVYTEDHRNVKTSTGASMGSLKPCHIRLGRFCHGIFWQTVADAAAFQSTKAHFCDTERAEGLVFQRLTLEILVC